MSDLKNKLIKLAYDNPELREDILPLVKTAENRGAKIEKLAAAINRALRSGDNLTAIDAMMDLMMVMGWQLKDMGHESEGKKLIGDSTWLMKLKRQYK